jgi:hypothetical protein
MKLSISDQHTDLHAMILTADPRHGHKAGNDRVLTIDSKSPLRLRAVRVSSRNKYGLPILCYSSVTVQLINFLGSLLLYEYTGATVKLSL